MTALSFDQGQAAFCDNPAGCGSAHGHLSKGYAGASQSRKVRLFLFGSLALSSSLICRQGRILSRLRVASLELRDGSCVEQVPAAVSPAGFVNRQAHRFYRTRCTCFCDRFMGEAIMTSDEFATQIDRLIALARVQSLSG